MTRRIAVLAVALVAAGLVACADLARTNPYDPDVSVQIVVTGPDTLFSLGEQSTYTASVTPSMPDTAIEFGLSAYVTPLGRTGAALVTDFQPPVYPATTTVKVEANIGHLDTVETVTLNGASGGTSKGTVTYRHTGTKFVVLTQRITHIGLRCPNSHACDTLSAGGVWSVRADPLDALNNHPYFLVNSDNTGTGPPIATYTVRDTTVASFVPVGVRVATVTAIKTGTTWIVGTNGAMLDSLRLVVR